MKISATLSTWLFDVKRLCGTMSWYSNIPGSRSETNQIGQGHHEVRRRRRRPHSAYMDRYPRSEFMERYVYIYSVCYKITFDTS